MVFQDHWGVCAGLRIVLPVMPHPEGSLKNASQVEAAHDQLMMLGTWGAPQSRGKTRKMTAFQIAWKLPKKCCDML